MHYCTLLYSTVYCAVHSLHSTASSKVFQLLLLLQLSTVDAVEQENTEAYSCFLLPVPAAGNENACKTFGCCTLEATTDTIIIFLLSQDIIKAVLSSGCVGPDIKHNLCFGLLLKHLKSSEIHWLHADLTVSELTQRYEQQHLEAEWRSVPLLHDCF